MWTWSLNWDEITPRIVIGTCPMTPDDLDVICAEAGLSLDATLMRVADEMATTAPEMSDEYSLTSLELGFLPERQKALENMADRCNLQAVRGMVNTMMQAERYGTPLAHSLRVLSQESRDDRMLRAEEKAARLPALLTVPITVAPRCLAH